MSGGGGGGEAKDEAAAAAAAAWTSDDTIRPGSNVMGTRPAAAAGTAAVERPPR